jgi:DNA-binding PadR family transcriptional regulator
MTDFEVVVLRLVAEGNGTRNWHTIASAIPSDYLEQSRSVFRILNKLVDEGLVMIVAHSLDPHGKYDLTPKGREVLESYQDKQL